MVVLLHLRIREKGSKEGVLMQPPGWASFHEHLNLLQASNGLVKVSERAARTEAAVSMKERYELAAYEFELGRATMLFTYANTDAAAPSLLDTQTGDVQQVKMRRNQAPASSAHLVVSLVPTSVGTYPAVLELAPNLSPSAIARALNFVAAAFRFESKRGPVDAHVDVLEQVSRNLLETVEAGGEVTGFELRRLEAAVWDGFPEVKGSTLVERFMLKRHTSAVERGVERLKQMAAYAFSYASDNNYDNVVVHYVEPETKRHKQREFEPTETDALSQLVGRRELVTFDEELPSATDTISPLVQAKLAELLVGGQ